MTTPAGAFLFFCILFVLYFLPSIMAYSRNHRNATGVLVLNIFLGWTLIFWVGALVWALYKKD